jgi:hypothetical protein
MEIEKAALMEESMDGIADLMAYDKDSSKGVAPHAQVRDGT